MNARYRKAIKDLELEATSYTLQQGLNGGSWSSVYSGAATSSTLTVTASGSYTYQVQACNSGGCSAFKASTAVA
ncbi:MAG: hypothetical protein KGJ32_13050, partial [Xanthomonadaceae bacterium]|nr:hypothetical protein [Xanthomonadaceae bacterium]